MEEHLNDEPVENRSCPAQSLLREARVLGCNI
jgi:hypothetical protein